jgi:uncharacterized protein with von Willebrand factor type A (vWA) domain
MKELSTLANWSGTSGSPSTLRDIVQFCRFARDNGLHPGLKAVIDSVRAVRIVDDGRLDVFRYALRANLCTSKDEWGLFDQLFDAFWYGTQTDRRRRSIAPIREATLDARYTRAIPR